MRVSSWFCGKPLVGGWHALKHTHSKGKISNTEEVKWADAENSWPLLLGTNCRPETKTFSTKVISDVIVNLSWSKVSPVRNHMLVSGQCVSGMPWFATSHNFIFVLETAYSNEAFFFVHESLYGQKWRKQTSSSQHHDNVTVKYCLLSSCSTSDGQS